MKKILASLALLLLVQTASFAQKGKVVDVKNVPERFVKDFQKKEPNTKNATWLMVDSVVYDVTFDNNGNKVAYRYSPKGTETRWYIASKWYPQSIQDTVTRHYPKFKIDELYALSVRDKMTYQAQIVKRGGFIFRKIKSIKLLNFETSGKFIDEIDLK